MIHKVRITWEPNVDWDGICQWAVDQFGLPGHRFEHQATGDYMDFLFFNEQDAILFTLKWVGNERKTSTLR